MTAIADTAPGPIVRWHYLGYSALALAVMTIAITSHERWFLNFVHVITGVMWTGIDLFMGFVMGPILRRVDLSVRREIIVRWHYLGYSALALVVMMAAITSHERWFLNFVHVICGVMWTGIDLFMGFVIGPILRRVDLSVRREIIVRLVPKTLFLMPTLSIITGTTGWFLAKDLGFLDVPWPQFVWVAAALTLVVLMTIQGTGYLLPTNLRVCMQLRGPNPDFDKISRMMRNFFLAVAMQGTMQVLTIVIMARFVSGL